MTDVGLTRGQLGGDLCRLGPERRDQNEVHVDALVLGSQHDVAQSDWVDIIAIKIGITV